MKSKKRYFLLIFLAIVPFYKFYHPENYCFGDIELLIIFFLSVPFIIAFITIVFNNLYTISLGKQLFDYGPLIIAGVFLTSLFLVLAYHDENVFKNEMQSFKNQINDENFSEITLFEDATFEFRNESKTIACFKNGTYYYKNDTLFLNRNDKTSKIKNLDSVYIFDKNHKHLKPINPNFPTLILEKK